ncbi:MAG: AsnC family protein [SAR324 cluster bacterium]|nr:AsnC family protein [SAR324 cluster bacterium]
MRISALEQQVISAIQEGLPLVSQPYAQVGLSIGLTEQQVIECLTSLVERQIIRRFGLVVKHRSLGYNANAMVVWDIADELEQKIGEQLKKYEFVTLCYSRPRKPPSWPYNLFCMIHGTSRDTVLNQIEQLKTGCALTAVDYEVLFSRQCFKQRGARYFDARN